MEVRPNWGIYGICLYTLTFIDSAGEAPANSNNNGEPGSGEEPGSDDSSQTFPEALTIILIILVVLLVITIIIM